MSIRLRPGVVVMDKREEKSGVLKHLLELGVSVRLEFLEVGDYLLPGDILVERKTARDFISSLLDGRLFEQASGIASASRNPTMIVEGDLEEALESFGRVKALWGALASLGYDFRITLFYTPSPRETAELLSAISERSPEKSEVRLKPRRKRGEAGELQLSIVASLPGVGAARAKRLLERLGSVRAVFDADPGQLSRLGGIPYKTSLEIYRLINSRYQAGGEEKQERINHF